ncbi:putative RNA-directed DNA polymerase from transposon X-element [Trichonephila clavipes]|nr:putative RNA-directed DNA polymerase from transposon X-element [Trichonephila clavipes]
MYGKGFDLEFCWLPSNVGIIRNKKLSKPWWNSACHHAKKEQRSAWGIFRSYPTTVNLIAFKRAKVSARRIRHQSQRYSWIQYISSITSSTTSQQLWRKVKAANGLYRDFTFPILETSTAVYSSPTDVATLIGETFANTSRLHGKGCDIKFSWIPIYVGITGNEQAGTVARSATTELPLTVRDCDMKRVIQHCIDNAWQES